MSQDLFQVACVESARVVELELPVSLDSVEFDRINQVLSEVVGKESDRWWVLDLSKLSYMGSAALGLLVNLRQQVKQGGGKLLLCGMSPRLLQIFRACCMERLFVIKTNRAEALKSLGLG